MIRLPSGTNTDWRIKRVVNLKVFLSIDLKVSVYAEVSVDDANSQLGSTADAEVAAKTATARCGEAGAPEASRESGVAVR